MMLMILLLGRFNLFGAISVEEMSGRDTLAFVVLSAAVGSGGGTLRLCVARLELRADWFYVSEVCYVLLRDLPWWKGLC